MDIGDGLNKISSSLSSRYITTDARKTLLAVVATELYKVGSDMMMD